MNRPSLGSRFMRDGPCAVSMCAPLDITPDQPGNEQTGGIKESAAERERAFVV